MFWTSVLISLAEFVLSFLLAVFIVYWSYKSFDRFNTEFDAQQEIYKGNTAVAILMSALMYGTALIMREAIYPVIGTITVGLTSHEGHSYGLLAAYVAGHLLLGFLLAVGTVQLALKAFARLNREIEEELEIAKGNNAVAILMGAVVIVISLFMQQGVGALTKSMIPQPKLGGLRMLPMDEEPESAITPSPAPTE